ncbi:hypothetical protein V8E54_012405 [Elaphomyces granulatus]
MVSSQSREVAGQKRMALSQPAYPSDNGQIQTRKKQIPFARMANGDSQATNTSSQLQVLHGQDEREQAARLTTGNGYLEMVERIAEATPPNLQDMVSTRQLTQLNCMTVPALTDAAAISLQGDC